MNKWLTCAAIAALVMAVGSADAKKPNKPGAQGPLIAGTDLVGESLKFKVKSKNGVNQINNFSFYIANVGDTDAPNSRVEFWLSTDEFFSPVDDPLSTTDVPDTLIHTQSLGKVKAGKVKKRTVGGGHLKQISKALGDVPLTGHIIAVIDADNSVLETVDPVLLIDGEANNTFHATLPGTPQP